MFKNLCGTPVCHSKLVDNSCSNFLLSVISNANLIGPLLVRHFSTLPGSWHSSQNLHNGFQKGMFNPLLAQLPSCLNLLQCPPHQSFSLYLETPTLIPTQFLLSLERHFLTYSLTSYTRLKCP